MLNSYNPYNIISLDMSSKDKSADKAYMGTRLFPVSFYTTTDDGNNIPFTYGDSTDYPLYNLLTESQNYDYSEAQLENTTRTGSFLVVPWLITYGLTNGIWNFYDEEPVSDLMIELHEIQDYIATNNLVLDQEIGDLDPNETPTGFVVGIAADGALHVLALDLQQNSDNVAN